MYSKIFKVILTLGLILSVSAINIPDASAATKVMWGKTELKLGQIGKVTIKSPSALFKLEKNNKLTKVRNLKAGEEFRVYSYKNLDGYMYGVGGGNFIYNIQSVKYETPSKSKLALLDGKTPVVTLPTPKPVNPNPITPKPVTDKNTAYKEKLNTIKNTKYKDYKEYANAIFKEQSQLAKDDYNLQQESVEAYYHFGIEVDEVVLTFNDGAELLAFKRQPQMGSAPNNRSAILYNNEYYLSVPILEYVLNAALDSYWYQDEPNSKGYDGMFSIGGATSQPSTAYKDESNKQLGYYNTVTLKEYMGNRILTISEREYPFASGGVDLNWSSMINPYSNGEVKEILDIQFDMAYDKASKRMTFHFDKPLKQKNL